MHRSNVLYKPIRLPYLYFALSLNVSREFALTMANSVEVATLAECKVKKLSHGTQTNSTCYVLCVFCAESGDIQ